MRSKKHAPRRESHELRAEQLRWRCDPGQFAFETTADLEGCAIQIIGQPRAQEALRLGLSGRGRGYNIFVSGEVGCGRSSVVKRTLADIEGAGETPADLVFVHNFRDPDQPWRMAFPAGQGKLFRQAMEELVQSLHRELPQLFDSASYRARRARRVDAATVEQKARFKKFEKRVEEQGFALTQVEMGPYIRSQIKPVVGDETLDMDTLETRTDQGAFDRAKFEALRKRYSELRNELEGLSREVRQLGRTLRRKLLAMDREMAEPLVQEATSEIGERFVAEKLETYLALLAEDVLEHLEEFRDGEETPEGEPAGEESAESEQRRYLANLVVDNSGSHGRPVIWETAPSYRNLFGIISKGRTEAGEWECDHTCIKAGSLLRANGGFLVLDAMDVLAEAGVWAALKRTLRHEELEIQTFDPVFLTGASLKPEPVPIDVKVLMIGTPYIYRALHALDEDFKKIFKVKAEFATRTARDDEEVHNYACLIHKRCREDKLLPFDRRAVAAVVEHGVRLAGRHDRLTTRFGDITDLVREAGYWARLDSAERVEAEHVDRALRQRTHRVDLTEERLRERIAAGEVLLDLSGEKVAQVNGLAVLDLGDHEFGQPTRITATTAMGRVGIIDIDREAEMTGSLHTKGVLIFTGILRDRFAQNKPLALTASICFEQSYDGIDGDSASSAELYALLSSLAEVPVRQGIAVTGSVNQRGEVQPIGGVNEKIEGYFDLCRLIGLDGEQGVLIPQRNVPHLMLRKDVVEAVSAGTFHVWAVATIEQGLEVLTDLAAGERDGRGSYPPDSILGRADLRLARLAEDVGRFGTADRDAAC